MTALTPHEAARELTVLAWRRTLLRGALIAVVAARIFTEQFGLVVLAVAFITLALAAVLNLAVTREHSRVRTGLDLPAPKVPSALTRPTLRLGITVAGTLVLGCAALLWVWAR